MSGHKKIAEIDVGADGQNGIWVEQNETGELLLVVFEQMGPPTGIELTYAELSALHKMVGDSLRSIMKTENSQ